MTRVLHTFTSLTALLSLTLCLGCAPTNGPATGGTGKPTGSSAPTTTPTAEANVNDLPGLTDQMVAEMKKITDEKSAQEHAPKLEALAEKVHAIQEQSKTGKGPAVASPEKFAERQMASMEAYGKEMARVSQIPGAGEHLQGMIKKFTP